MTTERAVFLLILFVCLLAVSSAQECAESCLAEPGCGFHSDCLHCEDLEVDDGECNETENCFVTKNGACAACGLVGGQLGCSPEATGFKCAWDEGYAGASKCRPYVAPPVAAPCAGATEDACLAEEGCGFGTVCRVCADQSVEKDECSATKNCFVRGVSGAKSCEACSAIALEVECAADRTGGKCVWDKGAVACKAAASGKDGARNAGAIALAAAAIAAAIVVQ